MIKVETRPLVLLKKLVRPDRSVSLQTLGDEPCRVVTPAMVHRFPGQRFRLPRFDYDLVRYSPRQEPDVVRRSRPEDGPAQRHQSRRPAQDDEGKI